MELYSKTWAIENNDIALGSSKGISIAFQLRSEFCAIFSEEMSQKVINDVVSCNNQGRWVA